MTTDFTSLAMPGILSLKPYQPGKPIEELERELGIRNTLKLASNENPLGPSPQVLEALQNSSLAASLALYPDGAGYTLKHKLAETLSIRAEQITLGNGSNDVLDMIARVFLGEEREAVFSQYAFAVYPISTQAVGAQARIAPALPATHEKNPYGHDLQAMLDLITNNTRVVFIANPNNPTGTWLDAKELDAFMQAVPEKVIVVVDEAYFEYVREPDYPNALDWLDNYPNLIVTRTFSKIYALAGLRVGYAVSSPQIADLLNRVRQPFNVNSLALQAATLALQDQQHLEQCVQVNLRGIQFWMEACQARGLEYIPTVGNFMTVNVARDAQPVYQKMLEQGVIVRPIANYGMPQHLRITISTEEQNARCLAALDKALV